MTPDVQAALDHVRAFLDAWTANVGTLDDGPLLSAESGPRRWAHLTPGHLRTLLAAVDQEPTVEWGVRLHVPGVGPVDTGYSSEDWARVAASHGDGAHRLVHRHVIRRPDDVGAWIEGEPEQAGGATR